MLKFVLSLFFILATNTSFGYVLTPPECRLGKLITCLKSGQLQYVVIYDTIQFSDYAAIRHIAENLPEDKPFPTVYLQSQGGSLAAGYEIGKIFRKHSVTVKSGNPITGDLYSRCSSSCVIIAAGATKRHLNHIGLHSPTVHRKDDNTEDFPEEGFKELERYLAEMGMDTRLYTMIRDTKREDLLDIEYKPNHKGSDQFIVQLGFYQGETPDEDHDEPSPVRYTHRLYDRAALVFAGMNGSSAALRRLVDEYIFGSDKIKPDAKRARVWLKIGADNDDLSSLHNLGVMYMKEHKERAAAPYFRRAAEIGYAVSQNNYGWYLYKGKGVKQNKAEAVFWIVRAAEQGEPFAYGSLCEIYGAGDVFSINNIEAMKWCRLATELMPLGKARDEAVSILDRFARRMTDKQIAEANQRVDIWQPLKQADDTLKDKDDKSKPKHMRHF